MLEFLWDIIKESLLDSIRLVPFLFLTYLIMEWLEHRTGSRTLAVIRRAGKAGPLIGSVLGIFPQCGFAAAASNLYAGGLITAGTLTAVFLSTSDEMLPIFISEAVPVLTILKILGLKLFIGAVSGFALDFLYRKLVRREIRYKNIHTLCESAHCHCEEGVFASALRHTIQITLFIFLITLLLNGLIAGIPREELSGSLLNVPVAGELIAGLLGLIPNCAASVILTQMYLEGVLGAGAMLTGLLTGAGVGILVLFRMNKRHIKQNVGMIAFIYFVSVLWGVLLDILPVAL